MATDNPFDMNEALQSLVTSKITEMMPILAAQATLTAGNALRAQAYGMNAAISVADFIVTPKKLSDNGAIVLLRQLKYVQNTYRLLVAPAYGEDKKTVVGRSIVVFFEDENNLLETKFVQLTDEAKDELNRQLDLLQLGPDGTIELCFAVIPEPIEGYEYFVDPKDQAQSSDVIDVESKVSTDQSSSTDETPPKESSAS